MSKLTMKPSSRSKGDELLDLDLAPAGTRIDTSIRLGTWSAWASVVIGSVFLVSAFIWWYSGAALNEVGDYVGGVVGAFWSLAALLFVYVAFRGQQKQMLLQQQELRETRRELELQREEMGRQTVAHERQTATLERERLDTVVRLAENRLDETLYQMRSKWHTPGFPAKQVSSHLAFRSFFMEARKLAEKTDTPDEATSIITAFYDDHSALMHPVMAALIACLSAMSARKMVLELDKTDADLQVERLVLRFTPVEVGVFLMAMFHDADWVRPTNDLDEHVFSSFVTMTKHRQDRLEEILAAVGSKSIRIATLS
ncbi:MAG: hypothetical protein AAGG50_13870 [Bacteroidota bacterium]